MTRRRRAQWPSILAGAVIVVAGVAVAFVEAYRLRLGLPRASLWVVVAATAAIVLTIRVVSRRRD